MCGRCVPELAAPARPAYPCALGGPALRRWPRRASSLATHLSGAHRRARHRRAPARSPAFATLRAELIGLRHCRNFTPGRRTALSSSRECASRPSATSREAGARDARARPAIAVAHPVRLHHLLPHSLSVLHHRARGLARRARGAVAPHREGDLPRHRAPLDQDLRRVLRHGRGLRRRPLLRVRHQLERAVAPRRQCHRPA